MTNVTADPIGEILNLSTELAMYLTSMQYEFTKTGTLPIEESRQLSHAVDLASRIQKKAFVLSKARHS